MKPRLLIIDNEMPIANLLKGIFTSLGAEASTATDSQAALRVIESSRFDGVLVDIDMPVIDGFELTQRIRASVLNQKIPIVVLTNLDDTDTMREAFRAGATCFLSKPFSRDGVRNLYATLGGPVLL